MSNKEELLEDVNIPGGGIKKPKDKDKEEDEEGS